MTIKYVNNLGKVTIDDSIITNIAVASVIESYGVVGLASVSAKDGIYELLGINNLQKGVKVQRLDNGTINVSISLFMKFGVSIPVVAQNLIENVKYNIEKSLKVSVSNVDIYVQGIEK
ncbi:Asp23/Gls24 family envelope stress response protein [Anaerococcus sp. AGMB09787]|uniref:Asp23/Gls24 family envelope stress response protein n=1 Tax=Anaerococcus sp. AGMB09787 TaxID=2922869 RepID=UPI001FAEB113|nr:Asp23/Gls24 family envelope stress response protein [Anaerococcus sp. AGMB09787]